MCERRKQTPVRGEHIPSKSADIWSNHYQRQIRKKEAERKKKKKGKNKKEIEIPQRARFYMFHY